MDNPEPTVKDVLSALHWDNTLQWLDDAQAQRYGTSLALPAWVSNALEHVELAGKVELRAVSEFYFVGIWRFGCISASKDIGHQGVKNIFKKVAKIPPGELQTRGCMIKCHDDIDIVGC